MTSVKTDCGSKDRWLEEQQQRERVQVERRGSAKKMGVRELVGEAKHRRNVHASGISLLQEIDLNAIPAA